MKSSFQRFVLPSLCLFAGAFLRVLHLHAFAAFPLCKVPCGPDVSEYIADMYAILQGMPVPAGEQIHAPLYGWFLAGLYHLCAGSFFAMRLTQSLLVLVSGLLFYAVLKDYFRNDSSPKRFLPDVFLALFCLWPSFVLLQCDFFSENLLLALTGLLLFLLHKALSAPPCSTHGTVLFAAAGLSAGLCIITHPISLFLLAGGTLFLFFRHGVSKRAAIQTAVFALAACVAILPVSVLRSRAADKPVLVQQNSGFNFFLGNHEHANGTCLIPPGDEWERIHAEAGKAPEGADRFFLGKSLRFIQEHPGKWTLLLLKKAVLAFHWRELTTWSGIEPLGLLFLHRYGLFFFALIGVPGLAAVVLNLRDREFRERFTLFLLLFASAYASQILLLTSGRYRMILAVSLMAFAPYFLLSLPEWIRDVRRCFSAAAALAAAALIVFLPVHSPDIVRERDVARFLLADSHYRTGNSAEAERQMAEICNPDASMLNFLGVLQLETGRIPEAGRTLQKAFRLFPELPAISLNLGKFCEESGDLATAYNYYHRAMERASNRTASIAAFNLGALCQKANRATDAERYYQIALEKDPSNLSPYRNFAILSMGKGNFTQAKRLLKTAHELSPDDLQRFLDYIYILHESGEKAQAEQFLRQVTEEHPTDPRVADLLHQLKDESARAVPQ